MKYVNKFSTNADYQLFEDGDDYVTPNVCYVEEANVVIVKPYIVPLLTFTVNDNEYQAEEGMTWEEWCNSEYNTYGYFIENETVYSKWYVEFIENVTPSDIILNNGVYLTRLSGDA